MTELFELQQQLTVSKSQFNEFSNFSYRSLEDILRQAKPILKELKCVIKLTDEMIMIGDRYYIKSTATLSNENGENETAVGYAREPLLLKGMSEPQVTGTASSYARKYALCSLLAIDDNKDVDSMDNRTNNTQSTQKKLSTPAPPQSTPTNTTTPLEQLTQFYLSTEPKDEKLKKFYRYYKDKIENNKWKGAAMDINALWEKWKE